jgi:hypothetical protein
MTENDILSDRISKIEKHIERVLTIQETSTKNIERLTKDIQTVISNSPTIAILETKVTSLEKRVNLLEGGLRKIFISFVTTAVIALFAAVFHSRIT